MKKRGALELSINTIVVIVIGVALLSLGLIFVKNLFGGVGKISDDIFGTADTEIGKLHTGSKFTVPTKVDVKQGERTTVPVFVGNDGISCGNGAKTFTLQMTKAPGAVFDETKVGAKVISQAVTLSPGQEGKFVIAVAATKDAPLSIGSITDPAYSVVAKCGTQDYDTSAIVIDVQKGGGLFF